MYNALRMRTLAINTASRLESVAVLGDHGVLAERRWEGNRDETEKLLPAVMGLFKKTRTPLAKIDRIIVVRGPGPFSATRVGVTVANLLHYTTPRAALFSIDIESLWRLRLSPALQKKNPILLIHAGGNFVARSGGGRSGEERSGGEPTGRESSGDALPKGIFSIEVALELPRVFQSSPLVFFGDLTDNERKVFRKAKKKPWRFLTERPLFSFSEALHNAPVHAFTAESVVAPLYWKPPLITPALHV